MKPHNETVTKPVDIGKVIDLAMGYNPVLVMSGCGFVHMWINEGCDITLDIIPALEEIMKRKKGITTFKYFTNAVMDRKIKREVGEKIKLPHQPTDEDKAKTYAWKRKRKLYLAPGEERLLNAYEVLNGSIS